MKILIAANHYVVASGRYMLMALKRLGHDVRSVGPNMGAQIWGVSLDERYVWLADVPEKGWTPDLVIYADAHLDWKRYGECPHVVYGVDNHVRDYRQYEADHFFLAHGHGARIGEANVTWLPCGYDPTIFTPGPKLAARDYDVAQIGVMYGPRAQMIYQLAGVPGLRMAYGTGPVYGDYAAIYQKSKISLVRSAAHDIAQRVWETAAMGCVVLMDDGPDAAALGLEHGKNVLMYQDDGEVVEAVRWTLAHPKEAQMIAMAGQVWAEPCTWDARLQVILDWVNERTAPAAQKETATDETRD